MVSKLDVQNLIERLKNDDADFEGLDPHSGGLTDYLKTLLDVGNLNTAAASGSAKKAIDDGISSLTDNQLRAIALEMMNNDVYMEKCPVEYCGEKIAWEDMNIALWEGHCYHCRLRKEKMERE